MKRALILVIGALAAGCSGSTRTTPLSPLGGDSPSTPGDSRDDGDDDDVPADITPDEDEPIIPPPEVDDPTFGDDCTSTVQCGSGLVCAGLVVGRTICTTPCIGSGKGGNDDCPSGFACYNFESTTLDGVQICLADWQLGASEPGYPFTTPPGGACSESNNTCQTQVCNSGTSQCVTQCAADRDCGSGEVCYAYPNGAAYLHVCWDSDLASYKGNGESCSSAEECDSGICLGGECTAHCRTTTDCAGGTVCTFWPLVEDTTYHSWTSVCAAPQYAGDGELGDACTSDADCAGEWCLEGSCTTPCATRDDCDTLMPGTECIQLNFQNGEAAFSGGFCLER